MDSKEYLNMAETEEHILVCLSPSPSNAKIIHTAARMAKAFGGIFSALYVKTSDEESLQDSDAQRLQENIRLAEQMGADIVTVYGEDIPFQIAEFARLSKVTKIVIGRSHVRRRHFWSKPVLTERLIKIAPNVDIHIIPDSETFGIYHHRKKFPSLQDACVSLVILFLVTGIGLILMEMGYDEGNMIAFYILGALLISIFTHGYASGILGSFMSVILYNYFFTEPRFTFQAYDSEHVISFIIILVASLITGTLASKLKDNAKLSAQSAFRTQILFTANQLLQQTKEDQEMIHITATQLMRLLGRNIIAYGEHEGVLSEGYVIYSEYGPKNKDYFSEEEQRVVTWVNTHKKRAVSDAQCLYMSIRMNNKSYGVIGIDLFGKALDSFENSILLSILGECALAIENLRNAKEKEESVLLAKNEQLRSNLLRAISHDLRTPLTSISGNASNLLFNDAQLDMETRTHIYEDIYEESQWLISLVENLLSITRLEEGRMNFNMSPQLVEEVVDEAMRHIRSESIEHQIFVEYKDEFMLARMDARLIIQVIINLVDNAIKYTPKGSEIKITVSEKNKHIHFRIADNGPGIPDALKSKVFDMFFTGDHPVADSRRSMGLGLYLCRSIIDAHGGTLILTDQEPHGCVFSFTLPSNEVNLNE